MIGDASLLLLIKRKISKYQQYIFLTKINCNRFVAMIFKLRLNLTSQKHMRAMFFFLTQMVLKSVAILIMKTEKPMYKSLLQPLSYHKLLNTKRENMNYFLSKENCCFPSCGQNQVDVQHKSDCSWYIVNVKQNTCIGMN